MKIGYDLRFAHFSGGGGVYTSQLLEALVKGYPQCSWSIYYNRWSEPQRAIVQRLEAQQNADADSLPLNLFPMRSPMLSLRQHLEFLACGCETDLYHYPHFDAPVGLRKVPLVLTIHDLYPVLLDGYCSRAKRIYFHRLTKYNARRAARIITVSQNTKRDVVERLGISEDKIAVIYNGYSPKFRPLNDTQLLEETRNKLKLPEKFILYCGNHKPHKNLIRLLEAFSALPAALKNAFGLVLTGPLTGDTKELREKVNALRMENQVSFTGLVAPRELPALYNLASLVVLPSLYEGFGLPLVEAMACGTCVVCSNTSALPEVVGEAARMFDPNSVDEISHVLAAALENDVDDPEIRAALLKRAAEFSWKKTAKETFMVYQSVAEVIL